MTSPDVAMTAADARRVAAAQAEHIADIVDAAPPLPREALNTLRATGLGRYLRSDTAERRAAS